MTSPIFFPAFIKKYIVQTKRKLGVWNNHQAHRRLDAAEKEARRLVRHKPGLSVRIINRLTNQVTKNYSGQSQK